MGAESFGAVRCGRDATSVAEEEVVFPPAGSETPARGTEYRHAIRAWAMLHSATF